MRLEMCSTVVYALGSNKDRLTTADLSVDSPYNTYKHEGLPPGPICNPGAASLSAALHPATADYLYFVLTGADGSHTFATSYADFLRAKSRSRELDAE